MRRGKAGRGTQHTELWPTPPPEDRAPAGGGVEELPPGDTPHPPSAAPGLRQQQEEQGEAAAGVVQRAWQVVVDLALVEEVLGAPKYEPHHLSGKWQQQQQQ